jgi:membrane protease YdiL (CAAX protease family)
MNVQGVRRARGSTIGLFLVLSFLIVGGYLAVYWIGFVQMGHHSIEGSVYRILGLNALLILGPIVGVLLWHEKLSLQDIGIVWRKLPFAMLLWVGIWLLVQGIELVAGVLLQGNAEIDPAWSGGGLAIVALLVGHLLGTALYEKMAFRGFLLRQCFPSLHRWTKNRQVLSTALAILVSQLAFTLFHVPWKLLTQGWSINLVGELSGVLLTGIVYSFLYLRTDNLFLVMGVHALGNAPTSLISPSIGTPNLLLLITVMIWILWPWVKKREEKASLPFETKGRRTRLPGESRHQSTSDWTGKPCPNRSGVPPGGFASNPLI